MSGLLPPLSSQDLGRCLTLPTPNAPHRRRPRCLPPHSTLKSRIYESIRGCSPASVAFLTLLASVGVTVSLFGVVPLMRRAGGKRLKRSNGRGLVASPSIPASISESHIYNYSANIDCRSNLQYSAVLHRENFSATL